MKNVKNENNIPQHVKEILDLDIGNDASKYLTFKCHKCNRTFTSEVKENTVSHFCSKDNDSVKHDIEKDSRNSKILVTFAFNVLMK